MNKLTFSTQGTLEKITEKSGTKAMELELISNFS